MIYYTILVFFCLKNWQMRAWLNNPVVTFFLTQLALMTWTASNNALKRDTLLAIVELNWSHHENVSN